MNLSQMLIRDAIDLNMTPGTKHEWLEQLVELLCTAWRLPDRDDILQAVLEREQTHSTAIGHGVAIPHAKTAAVPRLLGVCGIAKQGIDFDSPDGDPVRIAFLLVSPISVAGPHIRALAGISRIVIRDSVREELLTSKTSRDVIRLIKREDEQE
jgi:mannitol/fructose-specific phosphotransferase system IIA component (Ntr-type)